MIPYLVLDIENDNSNQFKRTAGNFLLDKIVSISYKTQSRHFGLFYTDKGFDSIPHGLHYYKDGHPDKMPIKVVVGHNLKHDLSFLWKVTHLQDWIIAGGKAWDTALAEYYLTSFRNLYPALRDIAVNKYGCKEREKVMEAYWEKGLQTSEISKDIVMSDNMSDTLDTEQVYVQQVKDCQDRGLLELLEIQNDFLLATTEMEYNGFKINLNILRNNRAELQAQLTPIKEEFYRLVANYVDLESFIKKPSKMLKILLFGGIIKQKIKVPDMDGNIPKIVKSGPNKGSVKMKTIEQEIYEQGLGVVMQDHWKTEKGNIQVDEKVLKELLAMGVSQDCYEIVTRLLKIRGIEKQISTYYDAIEALVYPDGMLRGKFNHTATVTGRSSSNDPNMQNIPKKKKSKVKQQFVSRYM